MFWRKKKSRESKKTKEQIICELVKELGDGYEAKREFICGEHNHYALYKHGRYMLLRRYPDDFIKCLEYLKKTGAIEEQVSIKC